VRAQLTSAEYVQHDDSPIEWILNFNCEEVILVQPNEGKSL
jgi:hypothetical protein